MDKKESVEEHEHLVKVLRSGGPKERQKEAKKQGKELSNYRKL